MLLVNKDLQYTNVTDRRTDRHRMTVWVALAGYGLQLRGKNL